MKENSPILSFKSYVHHSGKSWEVPSLTVVWELSNGFTANGNRTAVATLWLSREKHGSFRDQKKNAACEHLGRNSKISFKLNVERFLIQ
jgi:hypothetical protein